MQVLYCALTTDPHLGKKRSLYKQPYLVDFNWRVTIHLLFSHENSHTAGTPKVHSQSWIEHMHMHCSLWSFSIAIENVSLTRFSLSLPNSMLIISRSTLPINITALHNTTTTFHSKLFSVRISLALCYPLKRQPIQPLLITLQEPLRVTSQLVTMSSCLAGNLGHSHHFLWLLLID